MQFVNILTLVILNKLRCHTHVCQPVKLLDPDCLYKWTNPADPDQMASLLDLHCSQGMAFLGSSGPELLYCNNKIATKKLYI